MSPLVGCTNYLFIFYNVILSCVVDFVVVVVVVVVVVRCFKVVFDVYAKCLARVSLQRRQRLVFDLLEDELAEIPIPKAEPWAGSLQVA